MSCRGDGLIVIPFFKKEDRFDTFKPLWLRRERERSSSSIGQECAKISIVVW